MVKNADFLDRAIHQPPKQGHYYLRKPVEKSDQRSTGF